MGIDPDEQAISLAPMSASVFKYWKVDFRAGVIAIHFQDGRVVEDALTESYRVADSNVVLSVLDWEKRWIFSTTTRGHVIVTEGFNPNSPPFLNGRPVVYLDQNRWRVVSDVLSDSSRGAEDEENAAARELIDLVFSGSIVVPLSIGHMLETAGLYGERRYQVGVAMASLSGGWQIRDPLEIWKHEAEQSVRGLLGFPLLSSFQPITTEPGALFGADTDLGTSEGDSDWEKLLAMVTMPNVILDSLVDPQLIPKHPLTGWVDRHSRITAQVSAFDGSKEQRRRLARRRYWSENIAMYVGPYRRLTESSDVLMVSDSDLGEIFSASPMVGLLSELFVRRFIDKRNKWRRNDLIDMMHLSSAAAYADYVCAEAHTGTQLADVQRGLNRRESVFTSLSSLVEAIRGDGILSDADSQAGRAT